jgi:hypothetical protein
MLEKIFLAICISMTLYVIVQVRPQSKVAIVGSELPVAVLVGQDS